MITVTALQLLHWAIRVTFNLHVAACNCQVSGISCRPSKILFCWWNTYGRFTFQLMHKSWCSCSQPLWPGQSRQVCFFWNGSYSTFHFFMLRIFVMRTGIFLDNSFLFRFIILMGSSAMQEIPKRPPFQQSDFVDGRGLSESCDHSSRHGILCTSVALIVLSSKVHVSHTLPFTCSSSP